MLQRFLHKIAYLAMLFLATDAVAEDAIYVYEDNLIAQGSSVDDILRAQQAQLNRNARTIQQNDPFFYAPTNEVNEPEGEVIYAPGRDQELQNEQLPNEVRYNNYNPPSLDEADDYNVPDGRAPVDQVIGQIIRQEIIEENPQLDRPANVEQITSSDEDTSIQYYGDGQVVEGLPWQNLDRDVRPDNWRRYEEPSYGRSSIEEEDIYEQNLAEPIQVQDNDSVFSPYDETQYGDYTGEKDIKEYGTYGGDGSYFHYNTEYSNQELPADENVIVEEEDLGIGFNSANIDVEEESLGGDVIEEENASLLRIAFEGKFLDDKYKSNLDLIANDMLADTSKTLILQSQAGSDGDERFSGYRRANQIALKNALKVKNYLVSKGVSSTRVFNKIIGIVPSKLEKQRIVQSRVELYIN